MLKLGLVLANLLIATTPLHAQDIVGLEDCSKATSADKKIGCLQSNVEFLHRLIKKNNDGVQAQLKAAQALVGAAQAQASAAEAKVSELRGEIDQLETALERLDKPAAKR